MISSCPFFLQVTVVAGPPTELQVRDELLLFEVSVVTLGEPKCMLTIFIEYCSSRLQDCGTISGEIDSNVDVYIGLIRFSYLTMVHSCWYHCIVPTI